MALSATISALLAGRPVRCAHLVEFCFAGQARRLSNIHFKITTGGHDWFGQRKLASIEGLEFDGDMQSAELKFTISGVDERMLEMAITANKAGYIGEPVRVFNQFFDDDWQVLDDPIARAAGIIDGLEVSRGPMEGGGTRRTITLTAQNMFYGRGLPAAGNFTSVDQQLRFTGDRGLAYISLLQKTNIPFPW